MQHQANQMTVHPKVKTLRRRVTTPDLRLCTPDRVKMERRLRVGSTHTAAVSALTYQPVRRELITGHEDGSLKFWEGDTGKHAETVQHHKGWISDLYYWHEGKILFSCSVDGQVVLWSSSNQPYDIIQVGEPVFCLAWLSRKSLLLFGSGKGLGALRKSGKLAANGLSLLSHRVAWVPGHTGIVRCLNIAGNKIYSGGYDKKLVVQEVVSLSGDGEIPLKIVRERDAAHDAGVTCLTVAKDTDGSSWVVSGSFDKKVKLWTGDGKLVHIIQCSDTVTGLCYVPQTMVLWVAAGTPLPLLYEPKSGDNVTDYAPILNTTSATLHTNRESTVQLLKYIPETSEVIGSTKLKGVICWRYNPTCSVCCHHSPSTSSHVETLTFTSKVPILIFSGGFTGEVVKWEQLQLNSFLYSVDSLSYKEPLMKAIESEEDDGGGGGGGGRGRAGKRRGSEEMAGMPRERKIEAMKGENRGFVSSLFVESLDLLVASSLDGTIFVWGNDKRTVEVLEEMQRNSASETSTTDTVAGDRESSNHVQQESSSNVITRVAGFTCLHVLRSHTGCVEALAAVEDWTDGRTYLISGGWDLTLNLWDLSTGRLVGSLGESVPDRYPSHPNLIITSLAFSPPRRKFAYSTSDGQVFVRQFAVSPDDWVLVRTLDGHTAEVTQLHARNKVRGFSRVHT
ncbi:Nuclear distribution protein PAC1 [Geodia barretti]|uniref:Nuclear distribution protein PAC1 n=1 Tax=Geodia barretti TaxID=519541 RepID=A0AA35W3G6_GEOBA|nr:Nuclear distribution protein PAC1 [Geodia barretti]